MSDKDMEFVDCRPIDVGLLREAILESVLWWLWVNE